MTAGASTGVRYAGAAGAMREVREPDPSPSRPPRLFECAHLRVKDVDVARNQLVVRKGKGDKDRVTMLPAVVRAELTRHLEAVKQRQEMDLRHGAGWVELPSALARKYANAGRAWPWQIVYPGSA